MNIRPVYKIEYILNSYVKKDDIILDIGCGCGIYRNSTLGKYIGLDVTDDDYSENCPREVDILASATDIPLDDNSVDLVFSVSAFYLIPDYKKALNEFYRVLKPNGRLILFDYNKKTQKYLEIKDGFKHPCWTQYELKQIVLEAGFKNTEILLLLKHQLPSILQDIVVYYNEFRLGGRAIVTGVK